MPDKAICRSCGATIQWIRTAHQNLMPIDYEPCEDGNVAIVDGVAHVLNGDLFEPMLPKSPRYKSHFATCPNAAKHRRRTGGET